MVTNICLDDAQQILINQIKTLSVESLFINEAYDRITAHNLIAFDNLPPVAQAAVDGFALHRDDLSGLAPIRIKQYLHFGQTTTEELAAGQAVGVLTGVSLPIGTAAVIPYEKVKIQNDKLLLTFAATQNLNIKQIGEDIKQGEILAFSGTRITAGLISALIACRVNKMLVYRKPRVAILTLTPHAMPASSLLNLGQIFDSNSPLLSCLITKNGGEMIAISYPGQQNEEYIEEILEKADLIITVGGTFAIDESEAGQLLKKWGAKPLFWDLKIKPGSHVGAGILNNKLVICLSGNPMACAIGYELLVNPVLKKMQGLSFTPAKFYAICTNNFSCRPLKIPRFILGKAYCNENGWVVEVLPNQKSSMVRSLIDYNVIIEIPAGQSEISVGSKVLLTALKSQVN